MGEVFLRANAAIEAGTVARVEPILPFGGNEGRMGSDKSEELIDLSLLLVLLLFFFLFDEIGDGLGAFEAGNGGNTFGQDARIGVELLHALDGGECSGCFFQDAHKLLLCTFN